MDLPSRAAFEAALPWHTRMSNVWHQRRGKCHISQCYYIYYNAAGDRIGTYYFVHPIVDKYDPAVSGVLQEDEIREFTNCSVFDRNGNRLC
jgi:hypothetical protein